MICCDDFEDDEDGGGRGRSKADIVLPLVVVREVVGRERGCLVARCSSIVLPRPLVISSPVSPSQPLSEPVELSDVVVEVLSLSRENPKING